MLLHSALFWVKVKVKLISSARSQAYSLYIVLGVHNFDSPHGFLLFRYVIRFSVGTSFRRLILVLACILAEFWIQFLSFWISLIFWHLSKFSQSHINKIESQQDFMGKNTHYVNWVNYSSNSEVIQYYSIKKFNCRNATQQAL